VRHPDGRAPRRAPIIATGPASRLQASPALVAQRALFDAGLELAGVRIQQFAERFLQAADRTPEASCDELVRAAVGHIEGGAVAFVADEPELCERQLNTPASTVQEAAQRVLHALGITLLKARNESDVG
jgi:hypothetical protein